jgi:hypothetical protein
MGLGSPLEWRDYVRPLRFKIELRSPDGLDHYYTYDSFESMETNEIALTDIDVTRGVGQFTQFSFTLNEDPNDYVIDTDKIEEGMIVIISAGKSQELYDNLCYGKVYSIDRAPDKTSDMTLTFGGYSTAKIWEHTLVNFVRSAPSDSLRDGSRSWKKDDPNFRAFELFRDLVEDRDIIPTLGRRSLQSRANFTANGIDENITEFIPEIIEPGATAAEIANNISDMVGASWDVDQYNDIKFTTPSNVVSGMRITDVFNESDNGDSTSYSIGSWNVRGSIDPSDGFANRLVAVADQTIIISGESKALGYMSLFNKDLTTMLIPGAPKMRNLSIVMSKVGAGTDAPDPETTYVFGAVVLDKYPTNPPEGPHYPKSGDDAIIATFEIPIKDITSEPLPIPKMNLQFRMESFNVNEPVWLCCYERGSGEDNTIRWHHNADFETPNHWSGQRALPEGRSEGDKESNIGWAVSSIGPTFTHAFGLNRSVMCTVSDPVSIKRWTPGHPVEVRVIAPWIHHSRTMMQYLSQLLRTTAKKPLNFNSNIVTVPNKLFKIGSRVNIINSIFGWQSNKNFQAQIIQDHYWASSTSENAVGNIYCEVTPKAYVSPHTYFNR